MSKRKGLDLVILAGGRGKRISNLTNKIPKPLIKINGIHFLQYLINFYSKFNFKNIYILTGYKGEQFNKFDGEMSNFIPIKCLREKEKLDTGGALFQIKNIVNDNFILINGDSYINYNFTRFIKKKLKNNQIGRMLLVSNSNNKSNNKLAKLNIDKKGVVNFAGSFMNAGVYYLNKKIFKYLKLERISLENKVMPELINRNLINGLITSDKLLDIGSYSSLKKAKYFLSKFQKNISIFLDRDGVINIDRKYVFNIDDFKFRKNVIKTFKILNKKNINIFVVTNQAGIARGYFTENDFFKLSRHIKKVLAKKNIFINDVQYCPYHENGKIKKYKKKSGFRKPGNLMIKKIFKKWGIEPKRSYMIGDQETDRIAAKKSKIYFEYVENDILKQVNRINKRFN